MSMSGFSLFRFDRGSKKQQPMDCGCKGSQRVRSLAMKIVESISAISLPKMNTLIKSPMNEFSKKKLYVFYLL